MQMKSGFAIPKTEMLKRIQTVKSLTGEVVFLDPVMVNFIPVLLITTMMYQIGIQIMTTTLKLN